MHPPHEAVDVLAAPVAATLPARFIYIACPWTPAGGGMYKVADYLIQSQAVQTPAHAALLRPLDTRGAAGPVLSLAVLVGALARIAWGQWHGGLAGVHVNMGERMSLFRKGVVVATCRLLGVPVLLHLHARMDGFYRRLPAPLQHLTRRVFLHASAVVVIGPAAREFVLDVLRVPPARVEMIINGVPEPTAPPAPAQAAPGPCRVLFLGNLSERKGLVDLLFALAQPGLDTHSLEVTIAGGGDVARYRRMAAQLGVDGLVRFEGWCDQAKTRQLLARSQVLALPSHDEVLPLAVLEALAQGSRWSPRRWAKSPRSSAMAWTRYSFRPATPRPSPRRCSASCATRCSCAHWRAMAACCTRRIFRWPASSRGWRACTGGTSVWRRS